MAQRSCCVPGCSMKLGGGLPLHRFPNPNNPAQIERFHTWVMKIGGDIFGEDNEFIHKNRKVCHKHFEDVYVFPNMKLTSLAIPTLEMPDVHVGEHRNIELPPTPIQMVTVSSTRPFPMDTDLSSRPDNKMAPILYKVDASPPSNAVRILADIIGLELELRDRDFGTLEHKSPEHVKLNPMGTLPTLVDGDFVISESHATMKYLLSVYGGDKSESLYPSDVRTRALVDQAMFFNVGIYFIRLKVIVLPAIFGDLDGPTEKQKADIDEAYGVVEAYLANNKYIVTDHLTIADLSVGATTVAFQYLYKLDAARFPRTADWLARLEEHPSFKKILVPGSKILGELVNGAWQKNKQ